MSRFRRLDWATLGASREALRRPFHKRYYAMYSSVFGGITTDPTLMLVPVDDHVVHRGDGVFETLKCVRGRLYNLCAHLERLAQSAERISLRLPVGLEEIRDTVVETVRAGQQRDCLVRVLVSRGPGGLGVSPYECPASQLYVVAAALDPPFMATHPNGARAILSRIPVKPSFFATIKSCNYLPNVLMKKEAVDAGADFALGLDEQGYLTEGATENFALVTAPRSLCVPRPDRILTGTTMTRVLELAQQLVREGALGEIRVADLTPRDVRAASEMLMVGTTPDIVAVVEFEGSPVGTGRPGPVFEALSRALTQDILSNTSLHTPVFD